MAESQHRCPHHAPHDLFVVHAADDADWVHGYLAAPLELPAGRVVTPDDFRPGATEVTEFGRSVTSSRFTVVVLTPPSWTTPGPGSASSWPGSRTGGIAGFDPGSTTLASIGDDGAVLLWDVDVDSWRARACRLAKRNLTRSEWDRYVGAGTAYRRTCPAYPAGTGAPEDAPATRYPAMRPAP